MKQSYSSTSPVQFAESSPVQSITVKTLSHQPMVKRFETLCCGCVVVVVVGLRVCFGSVVVVSSSKSLSICGSVSVGVGVV